MSDSSSFSAIVRGKITAVPRVPAIPSGLPGPAGLQNGPGTSLTELGWGQPFEAAFASRLHDGSVPGRVARVDRGALTVLTAAGELRALVAAQLAHDPDPLRAPTVGDWVVVEGDLVTEVLERRSAIVRGGAASPEKPQVLAANVDKVFVVCSLEGRFPRGGWSAFWFWLGRAAPPRLLS